MPKRRNPKRPTHYRPRERAQKWWRDLARTRRGLLSQSIEKLERTIGEPSDALRAEVTRREVGVESERNRVREMLRDDIRLLRKHVKGYEARDGYSLDKLAIPRLTKSQVQRIRTQAAQLKRALERPHDILRPRSAKSKRSVSRFTGGGIRGQRHAIVERPSPESRVSIHDGNVEVTTKRPGAAATVERYFTLPRKAITADDVIRMLAAQGMPRKGFFVLQVGGRDTGMPVEAGRWKTLVRRYVADYSIDRRGRQTGFTGAITGMRFVGATLEQAEAYRRSLDQRRDAIRERQEKAYARERSKERTAIRRESKRRLIKGRL